MDKKRTEEQRERLRSQLAQLVAVANRVSIEMESVPHRRGVAHKSLQPKRGEYIVHATVRGESISGVYRDKDGQSYRFSVTKEEF